MAVELHAMARPNGRALDGFQFRLGGDVFDVNVALDALIPIQRFRGWMVRFQQRPANILIRLNMATSVWQCLPAMVAMREAEIFNNEGAGIGAGEFVRILNDLEEEPDTAAFRWAVVINDALGLNLQMQALPAAATVLCGKPTMRKYNVPTVLAAEWALEADLFESDAFSGIVPTFFADNPAVAEAAFHADSVSARRDVDKMMRALFQPELISSDQADKVCRKPRTGEAVYAYKLANLEALERPAQAQAARAAEAEQRPGPSSAPGSKRQRLNSSASGSDLLPKKIEVYFKV